MDYLILKELKDKGFPSKYLRIGEYFEHRVGSHSDDWGGESDYPCHCNEDRLPTLSELIEAVALPLKYFCLEQHSNDWRAGFLNEEKHGYYSGSTPEEAVARLWLAINKNGNDTTEKGS